MLIHGALIAEAYAPLCAEPALQPLPAGALPPARLRRQQPGQAPFSIAQQAADCRALLRHLGIERAHVVGHSSGGVIALQLALDAPEVVHSLVLLEPALLDVPSGPCSPRRSGRRSSSTMPATRRGRPTASCAWRSGQPTEPCSTADPGRVRAVGRRRRHLLRRRAAVDREWRFTREDARRITQPVLGVLGAESAKIWPGWPEVQARVQEWLPQTEPFVLAGANHALEEMDPRGVAEAMAPFLARHPMPVPRLSPQRPA